MTNYKSKNFTKTDAFIIQQKCDDCGYISTSEEELDSCEMCSSTDITITTSLEDESCEECGKHFDMWEENVHEHNSKGVYLCNDCFEEIKERDAEAEQLKRDKEPTVQKETLPLRVVSHSELAGKVISSVRFAEWNGSTVIHTQDNCICVMYSDYDYRTGQTSFDELTNVEDYRRLILGL